MKQGTIGFIGLGTMGRPMALNLLAGGWSVHAYHRDVGHLQPIVAAGGVATTSTAELTNGCDVVILMLPDDKAVTQVMDGVDGVAAVAKAGQVVIDCSTVHPETSRASSRTLAARGAHHLDAPVTGSRPQAESGQLAFLVGGEQAVFDRCAGLFEAMGKRRTYLGPSGAGTSTKLAANFMGATHLLALARAMELASRAGIDPHAFLDVIANSGARSAMADAKGPKILRGDWSADFALKLMLKDVALARDVADRQRAGGLAFMDSVLEEYRQAVERWGGGGDVCTVARRDEGTRRE